MTNEDRPGHTHQLPRTLLCTLVIICMALGASIVLVSLLAYRAQQQSEMTNQRLEALETFIADRGDERDEQYRTLDERITRKICAVLEALPEGGLLDQVRAENGCGAGVPLADLQTTTQEATP